MRKSGLTGDEAYVLAKRGKTTEDLDPLKKEIGKLKEDIVELNNFNGYKKVNFDGFVYGGYTIGTGIHTNDTRAHFIKKLTNGSLILFDGTKIAMNYFVVNSNNVNIFYYTPNVWNTSGHITIDRVTSDTQTVIVMIKRNDGGSSFTESTLNHAINTTKLYNNIKNKIIDLFMFMGQSNMAGRGQTSETWSETYPTIIDGAGYEFRAITDKTILYPITEPFGVNENKDGGINDGILKTGSMVTSFVNAYYKNNGGVPIVGVSASKGGSSISEWNEIYKQDAVQRLRDCINFLNRNGYIIRHKYILWCQGETDGDLATSKNDYINGLNNLLSTMLNEGIEKMFMVRIGNCNIHDSLDRYSNMIRWQTEFSQTNENVVMVSTDFAGMRDRGLMKDNFHYYQKGYNECGTYAGINTALYVTTGKEPTMYDTEDGSIYYSHKN